MAYIRCTEDSKPFNPRVMHLQAARSGVLCCPVSLCPSQPHMLYTHESVRAKESYRRYVRGGRKAECVRVLMIVRVKEGERGHVDVVCCSECAADGEERRAERVSEA